MKNKNLLFIGMAVAILVVGVSYLSNGKLLKGMFGGDYGIGDYVSYTSFPAEGKLIINQAGGDISRGGLDETLGCFDLTATDEEDIELQRIKLDLSSDGGDSTGPQDTTGYFECSSSTACDLTGTVKIQIDNEKGGAPSTVLSRSAAPATPGDLWNGTALANQTFASFYTIPAGESVKLCVVGSVTSNTAHTDSGEQIIVGISDVYHYKKASIKYDTASAGTTILASPMTVK